MEFQARLINLLAELPSSGCRATREGEALLHSPGSMLRNEETSLFSGKEREHQGWEPRRCGNGQLLSWFCPSCCLQVLGPQDWPFPKHT